jgi:hypothetical protein
MMKKYLVLALVLGVVGLTNASIGGLQISVDGVKDYQDGSLVLRPSDTAILDIWTDVAISGDAGFFALVVNKGMGEMAGGFVKPEFASYGGLFIYDDAETGGGVPVPQGTNGVWGGVTVFSLLGEAPIPAGSTIFDGILFHCNGEGPTFVQLYAVSGLDWSLGAMLDQVVITQIPEPITMVLLGLGGLFLRKR